MISALLLAASLGQFPGYVRTRIDDSDPQSGCLYWKENTTITWQANQQGNPETMPSGSEFTAFERSFATWQTVLESCASVRLTQGAMTATRYAGYKGDGKDQNVLLFRLQSCAAVVPQGDACSKDDSCGNKYDCWDHGAGALAITTTSYSPSSGKIFDADVEFNNPNFTFTTVDTPPCVRPNFNQQCVASDIQNTLTHEIGHMLGLAHDPNPISTMYASADPGELKKRMLDTGTAQFPCDVYPPGEPSRQCGVKPVDDLLGNTPKGCTQFGGALGWPLLVYLLRKRRAA